MYRTRPDPAYVKQLIDYDQKTGRMIWNERTVDDFGLAANPAQACSAFNNIYGGKPVTLRIRENGNQTPTGNIYFLQREFTISSVVFVLTFNQWPTKRLQFIDGDPFKNIPTNIQLKAGNMRPPRGNRRTGDFVRATGDHW